MKRDHYIDHLRAAATYGVVLWHCFSPVYYQFGPLKEWGFANIIFGPVIRWSVAVFIMVSGALLLGRTEPPSVFYRKRLMRICLPLLSWTLAYVLLGWHHYRSESGSHFFLYAFVLGFRDLLCNNLFYHLYFVSIILGLYVITPFLSKMVQALSQKELGALVLIGVTAYSLKFFFPRLIVADHFEMGSYLVYYLLGYYLYTYPPGYILRYWIYGVGAAAAIVMVWMNYRVEYAGGGHQDTFYRTDGFFVYAVSIAVFTLFQQTTASRGEGGIMRRLLLFISSNSYGIYIAHPLVITILMYWHFKWFTFSTALGVLRIAGYQVSFIMNNTWGAVVESLIVMLVLLVFFFVVKRLKLSRYLTCRGYSV